MAIKQNETQISDLELVHRIGTGNDRDAEAELFRRMAPRVRLYGLRHLRDEHAADDLTQQVLITTIEALRAARLREPDKLVSFMLGTCRMTVLDIRRGAQRKQRLLEQFVAELPVSVEPSLPSARRGTAGSLRPAPEGAGAHRYRHVVLRRENRCGSRQFSRSLGGAT